jgi:hypothetical protein
VVWMSWPTRCALPIQDRCVFGTITETTWPAFSKALTKVRMYGEAWAEGGPSSLVTWYFCQCGNWMLERQSCVPECAFWIFVWSVNGLLCLQKVSEVNDGKEDDDDASSHASAME